MKKSINEKEQCVQTDVRKSDLLDRYFILENRLQILNRIKECTYYNETIKIRRLNKLIFITKRKVRILQNHLEHAFQTVC